MRFLPFALLAALSLPVSAAHRDNAPQSFAEIAHEPGWKFGYDLGILTNWDYNTSVPGIETGNYFKLGSNVKLALTLLSGNHEWRNKLDWALGYSKTPMQAEWIKSVDTLGFESLWLWTFGGWWGSYAQFNYDTNVFSGYAITKAPVTYDVDQLNGANTTVTTDSLQIASPFQANYLKEQVGLFFRLMHYRYFTWEAKVGAYAMQGLARGLIGIGGKNASGNTDAIVLGNFFQIGPIVGTNFYGEIIPKALFYQVGAEVGYAAFDSSDRPSEGFLEHVNYKGDFSVTFKPAEWLALTYSAKTLWNAETTPGFQIQSKFMLSFPFAN